jgi:acyl CoA:acetate/3-ketoacid CoA transferase
MRKPSIETAAEAVSRIADGAVIAIGGTGAVLEADLVIEALERRFLDQGHPRELTLFSPMLTGDRLGVGGMNCFAHEGMTRRVIGASFSTQRHPRLVEMIRAGECEAYTVSMGAMIQLLTAATAGKPGVFTTAGIGSYLDPRVEGGRMNDRSRAPPVRVEALEGSEYLFYPTFPIDVAIIRGTTADENGYISFEEEPNTLGMLELAAAAHANKGLVIAQVKRVARANSLDPRLVRIPGPLVNAIVVHAAQKQVSASMADPLHGWNPALAGAMKHPLLDIAPVPAGPDRIILRRAALQLAAGDVINVGAGVATHLPRIALEERILERVTFTNEHGIYGGLMATAIGGSFVPALNADAIMDSAFQFNFYDGGGLDIAFLGFGQVDASGNVNVSNFGRECNGTGGFPNITDRTRRIVFCGQLTSGDLQVTIEHGQLLIRKEGRIRKFIEAVEQITLSGRHAWGKRQEVWYVSERAVFRLDAEGIALVEIAPGVDLDLHVRSVIGFELKVAPDLKPMDPRIFAEAPLGLADSI